LPGSFHSIIQQRVRLHPLCRSLRQSSSISGGSSAPNVLAVIFTRPFWLSLERRADRPDEKGHPCSSSLPVCLSLIRLGDVEARSLIDQSSRSTPHGWIMRWQLVARWRSRRLPSSMVSQVVICHLLDFDDRRFERLSCLTWRLSVRRAKFGS